MLFGLSEYVAAGFDMVDVIDVRRYMEVWHFLMCQRLAGRVPLLRFPKPEEKMSVVCSTHVLQSCLLRQLQVYQGLEIIRNVEESS